MIKINYYTLIKIRKISVKNIKTDCASALIVKINAAAFPTDPGT